MRVFTSDPLAFIRSLRVNKYLISTLLKREIIGRYKGSVFGVVWSFITPIMMLAIYTFVFSAIFKAKWSSGSDSKTEFALLLFAGLLIFNLFSECVSRAPTLISGNVNYVKKVVFPLEVIPVVTVLAALFHLLMSLAVWLLGYFIFFGYPSVCILAMPLVLIPLLLMTLGLTWLLSSLCVYLKDISQLVGVGITAMMFLSPIFYPASALPVKYQGVFMLNPLTSIIEMTRDVLFFAKWPDASLLSISISISLLFAYFGFYCFQRLREGFADVL
jgi:lipopolysaccharide transport system permease protein